jgi:peptidoglycan-associated lipoprotein
MKRIPFFILIAFAVLFIACSSKRTVVQPEQPLQEAPAQKTAATGQESVQHVPDRRYQERITDQQLAKIDTKEETPKYIEEKGKFEDIYFDYDQYDIRADSQAVLQTVASWMLKNTAAKILIEGHCDDRGTNEYNLALGDRRAKSVRDYLVALGIASSRIETISYGEEEPICTDQTEECWAKNRRAHFIILKEAGKQ